jgi:hypothetical protein
MIQNKFIKIIFLIVSISEIIYTRRVVQKSGMEVFKDKHWMNTNRWFKIVPLQEILYKNPQIKYTKIVDKLYFDYPEFVIAPIFPHKGYFEELFMLSIPSGRVQGECGHVFIDNKLSDQMARGDRFECLFHVPQIQEKDIQKVSGRVAVIAQHGAGIMWGNYYHSLFEVFGRLALLEMAGLEYDWLYVPLDKKYVREALKLWGVDKSKIIAPTDEKFCIEADELIVPSLVINTSCGHAHAGNFQHPVTSKYVKDKLLAGAQKENIDISKFSKKVFISRKDSPKGRQILNEDEIFELFEKKGFKRYEMCSMPVASQIMLFAQAEMVVSEQGSSLTNILFCKPNTVVVEIFQGLIDNCFWWVSHALGLQYIPIKTLPINGNYYATWRLTNMEYYFKNNVLRTNVPLGEIENFIKSFWKNNEN